MNTKKTHHNETRLCPHHMLTVLGLVMDTIRRKKHGRSLKREWEYSVRPLVRLVYPDSNPNTERPSSRFASANRMRQVRFRSNPVQSNPIQQPQMPLEVGAARIRPHAVPSRSGNHGGEGEREEQGSKQRRPPSMYETRCGLDILFCAYLISSAELIKPPVACLITYYTPKKTASGVTRQPPIGSPTSLPLCNL